MYLGPLFRVLLIGLVGTSFFLNGCSGFNAEQTVESVRLTGKVHGGQQPISGASLQLYAVGSGGDGASSIPLLSEPVLADGEGQFSITGRYTCPTADSLVYLTATGGNPGFPGQVHNSSIALMAMVGECGQLSGSSSVQVNEVTTVISLWPMAPFAKSMSQIGFSDVQSKQNTEALLNSLQGAVSGGGSTSPAILWEPGTAQKVYSLANLLTSCVNSMGGTIGDGSPCGQLFSAAYDGAGTPPADTVAAAIAIAQAPRRSTLALYNLIPPSPPFQPLLTAVPNDWSLNPVAPDAPVISPAGGQFRSGQPISIVSNSFASTVHYTVDGGIPDAASPLYLNPVSLTSAVTIRAVAVRGTAQSTPTQQTYSLLGEVSLSMSPSNAVLHATQSATFSALVSNSDTQAVRWSVSPSIGSVSPTGVYTAPAVVTTSQVVQVMATSTTDASKYATASVQLTPALSLAMEVPSQTVAQGDVLTGRVRLSTALTMDLPITLTSSNDALLGLSAPSIVVHAGETEAVFTYRGVAVGSALLTAGAAGAAPVQQAIAVMTPAIPLSFFGMTVKSFTTALPTLPFGTTRSWDADPGLAWTDLNPAPGSFRFDNLERFIELNQSRGTEMIYTFGRTPRWASSQADRVGTYGLGECAPPSDLGVWDAYVKAVVTQAAGRIKYWELWNEPNSMAYYCGDMPTLVTMSQHAYKIIKAIDPTALVLSPPMTDSAGSIWQGDFLYLGGAKYVDVVSFHGYSSRTPEDLTAIVAKYRVVMQANGVADKPLWDTESSWAGNGDLGTPGNDTQVAYISRDLLLHWSLGVARVVWYAYDGGPIWGGLWTSAAGASVAAGSYGQTVTWMLGASLTKPCSQDLTQVWTCDLSREGGYTAQAIWLPNATRTFSVGTQFIQYRDVYGLVHPISGHSVPVSDKPILLESASPPQL